ncbi:MAG: transporter substrate-binding domain-containing protein [Alphaproteobacteria bacterium]|nr:transporter substrate-binding domain-containing protein [Alphaproteobacteria bacterium]
MKLAQLLLIIVLSAGTAFAVGHYAVPSSEQTQTKETAYQRVMRTGTIRCQYLLYPQFIDRDPNTNKLSGLYVDFIEEMGRRLGLKIEWSVETGVADGLEGLRTGRYDVACIPYNPLPHRARAAEFSIPAFYTPIYTYARADDTRFDNNLKAINDPNITIAAMEGEVAQTIAAEDYPKAKVFTIPNLADVSQVMLNVETGKADVLTTEPSTAERYLAKNPGKLKRVDAPPVRLQSGGVSVAVGEEELKALLNTTIESMLSTGYVERLFIKSEKDKELYLLPAKPWRKAGE